MKLFLCSRLVNSCNKRRYLCETKLLIWSLPDGIVITSWWCCTCVRLSLLALLGYFPGFLSASLHAFALTEIQKPLKHVTPYPYIPSPPFMWTRTIALVYMCTCADVLTYCSCTLCLHHIQSSFLQSPFIFVLNYSGINLYTFPPVYRKRSSGEAKETEHD